MKDIKVKSSRKELLEVLEKIKSVSVLVIGDLILDRYIWGTVERISPEAPVPIVAVTKTEDRLGGAGNVVSNLLELSVNIYVGGLIGDDLEGEQVLALMGSEQVQKDSVLIAKGRPTTLKTRVIAQAQQVVRIDREDISDHPIALREGLAAAVEAQFSSVNAVIVSDYGKGVINQALWDRLYANKVKGVLGASGIPLVLDPHPRNHYLYKGISIAKPNRREAEKASGIKIKTREDAINAAHILQKKWEAERMLVTLGEMGLIITGGVGEETISLETVAKQVFDVSGAGDTVTALYTAAVAAGASPVVAGDLANVGAGIVVSEVGTVPIKYDQLRAEIEELG